MCLWYKWSKRIIEAKALCLVVWSHDGGLCWCHGPVDIINVMHSSIWLFEKANAWHDNAECAHSWCQHVLNFIEFIICNKQHQSFFIANMLHTVISCSSIQWGSILMPYCVLPPALLKHVLAFVSYQCWGASHSKGTSKAGSIRPRAEISVKWLWENRKDR